MQSLEARLVSHAWHIFRKALVLPGQLPGSPGLSPHLLQECLLPLRCSLSAAKAKIAFAVLTFA